MIDKLRTIGAKTLKRLWKENREAQLEISREAAKKTRELHPNLPKAAYRKALEKHPDLHIKGALAALKKFRGKRYRTLPERRMEKILKKLNLPYKVFHVIKLPGGKYTIPDFVILDKKLAIYVDGKTWHDYPHGTRRDRYINQELERLGWRVVRFWEDEVDYQHIKQRLMPIITNGAKVILVRGYRRYRTSRSFVYDFMTRRNHTLIVNGLILHNCNRIGRLPQELLSRFLVFHLRPYTDKEFRRVAIKVLTMRESKSQKLAEYIADKVMNELKSRDVRDAIKVARLSDDKQDVDFIVKTLNKYRRVKNDRWGVY